MSWILCSHGRYKNFMGSWMCIFSSRLQCIMAHVFSADMVCADGYRICYGSWQMLQLVAVSAHDGRQCCTQIACTCVLASDLAARTSVDRQNQFTAIGGDSIITVNIQPLSHSHISLYNCQTWLYIGTVIFKYHTTPWTCQYTTL